MEEEHLTQEELDEIRELGLAVEDNNIADYGVNIATGRGDGLLAQIENIGNSRIYDGLTVESFQHFLREITIRESIDGQLEQTERIDSSFMDGGLVNTEDPLYIGEELEAVPQIVKKDNTEIVNGYKEFIKQSVQEVYPDLWDYYEYGSAKHISINTQAISNYTKNRGDKTDYLIIKFPEIEITNSKKQKHSIKDLYILIQIYYNDEELYICKKIHGTRGLLSSAEKNSSYSHSHLHSGVRAYFHEFCLGSGELGMNLQELSDNFEEHLFELFLMQLDSYVRWESLEGGPYIRMENIRESQLRLTNLSYSELEEAIQSVLSLNSLPIELDYGYNRQYLFQINEDELEGIVNKLDLKKVYKSGGDYFDIFKKQENGEPVLTTIQPKMFMFKDEYVDLKCIQDGNVEINENWKVVNHPSYFDTIKTKLKNILDEYNNKIRFGRS